MATSCMTPIWMRALVTDYFEGGDLAVHVADQRAHGPDLVQVLVPFPFELVHRLGPARMSSKVWARTAASMSLVEDTGLQGLLLLAQQADSLLVARAGG